MIVLADILFISVVMLFSYFFTGKFVPLATIDFSILLAPFFCLAVCYSCFLTAFLTYLELKFLRLSF